MRSNHKQLYEIINPALPNDHANQVNSDYVIKKAMSLIKKPKDCHVIDVGCGRGESIKKFKELNPLVYWYGLDIEASPEVLSRTHRSTDLYTYDGVNFPFGSEHFDIALSNQVFEHIRHPENMLSEIYRVLKPSGYFIGSVSALEPYHSYSFWNYTPYGWFKLLSDNGFDVKEMRPGIDGISLITRHLRGKSSVPESWWDSSPLNDEINQYQDTKCDNKLLNLLKLTYAGHIVFFAKRY